MALAIVTETASAWVHDEIRGELAEVIDRGYELMGELCAESYRAGAITGPSVDDPKRW